MLMRTLRSQVRWIMIAIVVLFVLSIFECTALTVVPEEDHPAAKTTSLQK